MLEVCDLRVAYKGMIRVLEGMSFTVPEGKILALLGANGAGKSTTLKAISGMLHSDAGSITGGKVILRGQDVTSFTAARMVKLGVSHVMEGRFVFPDLTVKENLEMGAFAIHDKRRIVRDMDRCFGFFPGLTARAKTKAGYLSGGEQQMLAIARSLMARPELILLDEPSMGLAPIVVREVFAIINEINEAEETTFLLVEQNVKLALESADFASVVERGCIRLYGTAAEMSRNKRVQDLYLGIGEDESAQCAAVNPFHA